MKWGIRIRTSLITALDVEQLPPDQQHHPAKRAAKCSALKSQLIECDGCLPAEVHFHSICSRAVILTKIYCDCCVCVCALQGCEGQWHSLWLSVTPPHTRGRWCSPRPCSLCSSQFGCLEEAPRQCCPGYISGQSSRDLISALSDPFLRVRGILEHFSCTGSFRICLKEHLRI